ncbi:MAG: bifunctional diguanylate cyclase/phosphodiesterase [Pseudomonadota bacterium]
MIPVTSKNLPGSTSISGMVDMIPRITDDFVMIVDKSLRVLWSNPAMAYRMNTQSEVEPEQFRDWVLSQVDGLIDFDNLSMKKDVEDSSDTERLIQLTDTAGRREWHQISVEAASHGGKPIYIISFHDVTEIKHKEQNLRETTTMLEHRLAHDLDTGLPNSRALGLHLEQALRLQERDGRVGVLTFELRHFRELSTIHGPAAAEEVVQELVFAALEAFEEPPFLARLGVYDFAIVLQPIESRDALLALAETLAEKTKVVVPLDSGNFTIEIDVAAVAAPAEETSAEKILVDAQIAICHPDQSSRSNVRLYTDAMRGILQNRAQIYAELRDTLEGEGIEPFFQPQINIADGRVVGFEVLARWRHPERGLIPPGMFLGIAEETGLLPKIDDLIMEQALQALAEWREQGHSKLRVSLNASGFALRDQTFVERLTAELAKNGLGADAVSVEILESVNIDEEDDPALETIRKIKEAGIHLELDDFGTGYASIAMLVRMDVDTVKLDRSLVADLSTNADNRVIVQSTLMLAKQLSLTALAEGVETDDDLALLHELGCHEAQGYGISRPMARDKVTAWLSDYDANRTARWREAG